MFKHELNFLRDRLRILLLLIIFILPMPRVKGADGIIDVTYYPSSYNIATGTHFSGGFPTSLQTVDSDYFIVNSSGSATSTNAYNPTSYSPVGNTTLSSGTVGNLASNDGIYMTFQSYQNTSCILQHSNSSNAESSTTSGAYVDKVTLTFTPSLTGNHLIIASAELRSSSNAYAVQVQMTIDGVTYANPMWQPDDPNTWESFFTSKVINFNTSAHTIGIKYASEDAAQTVTIRNARIMALLLFDFVANETEGEQAVTSGTYVDIVSKTFVLSTPGVYLILATAEVNAASTAYSISTRLEIDGEAKDIMATEGEAVTDYEIFAAHNVTALSAASHTVKIRASRETTGTMYIRRARITAVRLTDYYDYRTSGSEQLSSTTSTTWVDKATLTFTPSTQGDYLVMATAKISLTTSSAGIQPAINFTMDGAQIGYWQAGLSDATDFLAFAAMVNVPLSAVSHTFKIAYRTTNAFFMASIRDARIVAARLAQQFVSEVEFTGVSDAYNWARLAVSVDSRWTVGYVSVCIQVYDYQNSQYPDPGQAYSAYVSSGTADTDELHTINISDNPLYYTNSTGHWKVRIRGVRNTGVQPSQFDFEADHVEFKSTYYSEYTVATEFLFSFLTSNVPIQLNFTIVSQYSSIGVSVAVQAWNYSASAYATSGQASLQYISSGSDETVLLKIDVNPQFFVSAQSAKIRILGVLSTIDEFWQEINQVKLVHSYVNSPPVLNPIGNKIVGELTTLTFTATATDVDVPAQPLTFTLNVNAPSGALITADGVFTWTPTEEQGPGNYLIRVTVSDGLLVDYEDISVTVFEAHIHDLAVTNATASPTNIDSGQVVTITVTVRNQGTATETFNITVFYDETPIETKTVSGLVPSGIQILEFLWNTSGLSDRSYGIRAEVSTVSGETEKSNNVYTASVVTVGGHTSLSSPDWAIVLLSASLLAFGIIFLLLLRRRKKKTKPRSIKETDSFYVQLGMTHRQMAGKKILLEIDPTSDYNLSLSSFVSETQKNDELLFIVTNRNSNLHSSFSEAANARFLLLTSKTHYPQQINERETLLPADDLSVLLDACTRIQGVDAKKTVNLLFDNLSDVILRCGFEKTYNFIRLLLEAISSPKTTAVFVFNPTAHDQEIVSSTRGLFRRQITYSDSAQS